MKEGIWKYHKGFKNRPAHYFPLQNFSSWDKAQCGYFVYPDMLAEAKLLDLKLCCKKCLKSAKRRKEAAND